ISYIPSRFSKRLGKCKFKQSQVVQENNMKQRLRFARLLQRDSGARNPKERVTAPFNIRPNVAIAMPKRNEKSNNDKRRNSPASKIWQDNRSLCPREANSVDRHLMYQPCRLAPRR